MFAGTLPRGSGFDDREGRDPRWRDQLRFDQEHARDDVRLEDIQMEPIVVGQWRVMNAAAAEEVFGLLGFVEVTGDGYEVTFLSDPGRPITVATDDAARAAFATH